MPFMAGIILNTISGINRDVFKALAFAWAVYSVCLKTEISNSRKSLFLKTISPDLN